jgi:hypothetical protein
MTNPPRPTPARRPSSTPILAAALRWGGIVTALLALAAAGIGFAVSGSEGLISGLVGVLVAAIFLAITAISILVANRWFGDELYVPIFFGIVLGGWILKLIVFIVVLLVVRGAPWLVPGVFFVSLVAAIMAALAVDVVVLLRMRLPYASDVRLPGDDDSPPEGATTASDS